MRISCVCDHPTIMTGFSDQNLQVEGGGVVARPILICSVCKKPRDECRPWVCNPERYPATMPQNT